jgi:hypothetical protein
VWYAAWPGCAGDFLGPHEFKGLKFVLWYWIMQLTLANYWFEEYCLLGYNAVQSVESQQTFRRNVSPPSSGSKDKASKKPT